MAVNFFEILWVNQNFHIGSDVVTTPGLAVKRISSVLDDVVVFRP